MYVSSGKARGERNSGQNGWKERGWKDFLGIEKPSRNEVVLYMLRSTRRSHSWDVSTRGFLATDKAGKEVRSHMWCVRSVSSEFISDLYSTLGISIWQWLLEWIFLFYCSPDIMTFPFSWSTMARSLSFLWIFSRKPLKDFREGMWQELLCQLQGEE